MAEHLYDLGTLKHLPRGPARLESLHVWVIGRHGWQENLPEPFNRLSENETDPTYRVLAFGIAYGSLSNLESYNVRCDWTGWMRHAGMRRSKRHSSQKLMRKHARLLLAPMRKYYLRNNAQPSPILDQLGVPFEFFGRSL